MPKLAPGWNSSRKPSVVLNAIRAYRGKTLVFMDVDCIVTGEISPVTEVSGDVGLATKASVGRRRSRVVFTLSSRVAVFHPTPGAQAFAEKMGRDVRRQRA
jgi:hypothetical protein